MGKALLIVVLGAGLALAQQLYTAFLNEEATGKDQTAYQEETIAREIAASAFNLGMGVVRSHGDDVQSAAVDLNGAGNAGRSGTYASGRFAGGRYKVHAELTSPHTIRVVATGYFGRRVNPASGQEDWSAAFTMHDEYKVPSVLTANTESYLDVSFIESQAGYCSAVFYQQYTPDMVEGTVPEIKMLFAADNRDRRTARPSQGILVPANARMNFLIGVDKDCSMRPPPSYGTCEVREHAQNYTFKASDWDHVHAALEVEAGSLDEATDTIWALVEPHPLNRQNNRQRWRIAWEDIHNLDWDRPNSSDPKNSLQALKRMGYDGLSWPDQDSYLYRALRDYGNRPDYSDQVIDVNLVAASDAQFVAKQKAEQDQQRACGETETPVVEQEKPEEPPAGSTPPDGPTGTAPGETTSGGTTGDDPDPLTDFACKCTKNNTNDKTPILHRPPGNESNEQLLCLPPTAIDTHKKQHNDVWPTCRARKEIKNQNK